jgi:hypothetical protein
LCKKDSLELKEYLAYEFCPDRARKDFFGSEVTNLSPLWGINLRFSYGKYNAPTELKNLFRTTCYRDVAPTELKKSLSLISGLSLLSLFSALSALSLLSLL